MKTLAIVSVGKSYASQLGALASELGAEARWAGTVDEMVVNAGGVRPAAVVVWVAGAEERGARVLVEARAAGMGPIAVVGVAADHRLASRLLQAGASEYFALPGDRDALRGWLRDRLESGAAVAGADAASGSAHGPDGFSSDVVARPATPALPFPATMDEIEHRAAVVMVERMAGNKSAAAEALGISRSRLYRLLSLQPVAPRS